MDWNPWGNWPALFRRAGAPTLDMYEDDENIIVEADVPGFRPEDISVQVTPYALTMRGQMETSKEKNEEDYVLRERGFGEFYRTIRFPSEVKVDETRATYGDGVLKIIAPKVSRDTRGVRNVPIEKEGL